MQSSVRPGDRIRLEVSAAYVVLVHGRLWELRLDGIRLEVEGGRERDYLWRDIRQMDRWVPNDSNRRTMQLTVAAGALLVGSQFAVLSTWEREDIHVGVAAVGAVLGAGLGWIVGHAITHNRGHWEAVVRR
jgi:hypothetical protein